MIRPRQSNFLLRPARRILDSTILIAVLFAGCAQTESIDEENSVLIGLLLPFSGDDAAFGINFERAAMLARNNINAAGGINGKKLEFITRDTHSNGKRAAESLEEILSHPVKAVIGPESADVAQQLVPSVAKSRDILLSPVISGPSTLEWDDGYEWFRLAPSSAIAGRELANYLSEKGVTEVSLAVSEEAYHVDFIDTFERRLTEQGGEVLASVTLRDNTLSFSDEVGRIVAYGATHIVLSASAGIAARFINDMSLREGDEAWRWYLSPPLETPVLLQNVVPDALEGAEGVGIAVFDSDTKFVEEYEAAWKDAPLEGAFYYYDTVALLALSLETAYRDNDTVSFEVLQSTIRQVSTTAGIQVRWDQLAKGFELLDEGETIHYSGLTGPLVFDETGQQVRASMEMWTVKDGVIATL